MRAPDTSILVALLTAAACFRDGAAAPSDNDATLQGPFTVRDRGGAVFDSHEAPRDVVLGLPVPLSVPGPLDPSVLLLRGHFSSALAVRLGDARRTEALTQRTVALRLERHDDVLRVVPAQALEPDTPYTLLWLRDETGQAFTFDVSGDPALGARWVESWPSAQARVAPNLLRAWVRCDGYVANDLSKHLTLLDQAGNVLASAVERVACRDLGLPPGDCAWLRPATPMAPQSSYTLALDDSALTLTGAPIPAQRATFRVETEPDHTPPQLQPTPCATGEQPVEQLCVRVERERLVVRGSLDESALVTLTGESHGELLRTAAFSYANSFELALLSPATASLVRVQDLAGNVRDQTLVLPASEPLPALRIDEVLADPLGKEPAQEWVELLNSGPTPVSLMGFTLTTRTKSESPRGRAIAQPVVLAPHERALLVGPEFDPRDVHDGVLPASVRLVRLVSALSIANTGDLLVLRDPGGRQVDSARLPAALFEGQCTARRARFSLQGADSEGAAAQRAALADSGEFALDPRGACTPGDLTFSSP